MGLGELDGWGEDTAREAEHDRALQEKAWLQGYMVGIDDAYKLALDPLKHETAKNPYRKEKT
jgi:hypothetical protein